MKDSELKALISLLDDDDPSVEMNVRNKLIELGQEVLPELEAAWESQEDEHIQERIEEIIHSIQSRDTILDLREWRMAGGGNLLNGWILVSKYQFPELDFEPYRNQINRLVNRIWLEMRSSMTLPERLKVISKMLFTKERFRPNRKAVSEPGNFFLNTLLETKKGSPLSLGMLYLVLCEELQLPMQGMILPSYFVITYQDEKQEFFLDPFNKGNFFTRKDLEKYLEEVSKPFNDKFDRPSSKIFIILTLVQRLIDGYKKRKRDDKAGELEKLLDYIDPDSKFP
ncbi:MAG: transglutaminase-like domain-containing protein [Bacteroidia bacterium]|nr:transglutaminase-like domain-containing protein [Bacteroidia bacterium]